MPVNIILVLDVRGPPDPYIYLRGSSGPRRIRERIREAILAAGRSTKEHEGQLVF
jgi:hypothetical protein